MTDLSPSAKGLVSFPKSNWENGTKTFKVKEQLHRNTCIGSRLEKEDCRGAIFLYKEKPLSTLQPS